MVDYSGDLVACGEYNNEDNKDCYSFNGEEWSPLPPLHEDHHSRAYWTRSFNMETGLWLGGNDGSDRMVQELFTPEGAWTTLPIDSPYGNNYYPLPCIIKMNDTHLFFSGGYHSGDLKETWVLDIRSMAWTPSAPMLTPRSGHGCTLTADGEVLVAGGYDGGGSSVEVFNPSLGWRPGVSLPSEIDTFAPVLLRWKDTVLLLEYPTDLVWELEDQGWRRMDVTMGAHFYGGSDNAVLVPDTWRAKCP